MTPRLHIQSAGLMTTVQDMGRLGGQSLGIPVSGALDRIALRMANALVGNPHDMAGLEIRLLGPTIRVVGRPVQVALVGTAGPLEILGPERQLIPAGQSVTLVPDQVVRVGAVADSACCYLAVAGGFALPSVLGSLSTYVPAGLGGFKGRALQDGDDIALTADQTLPPGEQALAQAFDYRENDPIRVVLGPQDDAFTASGIETFLESTYHVSSASDRMGLRPDGPSISHAAGHDIPSDGIVTGSVQVPGTGRPIILLADRQTTGGYPKIASVISADLPRVSRLLPGQTLTFAAVDVPTAEEIRRHQERDIESLLQGIRPVTASIESLQGILMQKNLISGIVDARGRNGPAKQNDS